jgi:hypothetical protein
LAEEAPMSRPASRSQIETELGTEIKCASCGEFWPADPEFFYFSGGRPHSWCKACYLTSPLIAAKRQREVAKKRAARSAA